MKGEEFNIIETPKLNNPSDHPQETSVIERSHLELGKLCRIHNLLPSEAVTQIKPVRIKATDECASKE